MILFYKLFGLICCVYYLVIWGYTGRRNSTFSIFWPILGAGSILLGFVVPYVPNPVRTVVNIGFLAALAVFICIEVMILRAMSVHVPPNLEYLIVLGAQVRGTRITNSLQRRLDRAYTYWHHCPEAKLIMSGGQGRGEDMPEAEAMKDYLVTKGIPAEQICIENKSKTTEENLRFSQVYISAMDSAVGVVTNNFHIYRAVQTGKKLGYKQIYAVPSSSNPVLFVNYSVREGFGVLKLLASGLRTKSVDK